MFKGVYEISGFTQELAEKWDGHLRGDSRLYVDKDGEIKTKVTLSKFEAIKVRIAIMKYNLTHPYVLKITKYKGKRFRV